MGVNFMSLYTFPNAKMNGDIYLYQFSKQKQTIYPIHELASCDA